MNRISAFPYISRRWNKSATLRDRGAVIEMSGVIKIFFSVKRVFAWKLGETFETAVLQLTIDRLKNQKCFMSRALLLNNEISQTWLHLCLLPFVSTFILTAGWKPFMCLFKYHTSWWFHYYIITTLGNRSSTSLCHPLINGIGTMDSQQPDYSTHTHTHTHPSSCALFQEWTFHAHG